MKPSLARFLLSLFLFSFICSCQSLEDEGKKLFQKGLYEEALIKFEAAVIKDPSNTSAKTWVQETRMNIIDKGLLEVRFLRMGNNKKAAAEKLENLLRQQEKFQLVYSAAIMSTQEKEILEASHYITQVIKQAQAESMPTAIKLIEYNYDRIIAAGSAKKILYSIYPELQKIAQRQYDIFVASLDSQSFFSAEVAETFASIWKLKSKPVTLKKEDPSRFSGLKIEEKINNINPLVISIGPIRAELEKAFQRSLFYFSNSHNNQLGLFVTGNTSYRRDEHVELIRATYQEAYTSWEDIDRSLSSWETMQAEQKKYGEYKAFPKNIPPYKTRELVTRYRTKEFSYPMTIFKENYDVKLEGRFEHPQFNTSFSFSDSPKNKTKSHSVTMVEADVYPVSASFLNPKKIADDSVEKFTSKLAEQLKEDWIAQYCNSFETEAVHRCSRAAPFDKNVSLWYQKHFGVDYDDFRKITINHRK